MDITKILTQVETNFWWPKLRDDVKTNVNTCDVYQHNKASTTRMARFLQPSKFLKESENVLAFILSLE